MRKLILSLAMMIFAGVAMSQTANDYMEVQRAALKTEKKAIVADNMELTEAESTVFWPLYNEFNEKKYELNTKVYQLIVKYADKYETLTDEESVELWKENMKLKNELNKLNATYFKKFVKILSGKKAVKYFQIESKIDAMVKYELADQIPLVK